MSLTRTHGERAEKIDADRDDELAQVLDGYLRAIEAGDAPSPERLVAEHPAIADRLRTCLASLRLVGEIGKPAVGARVADQSVDAAEQLGDYRVIRQIGRGGMGIVYEAEQVSLGRRVALKVLPFASALDHRQLQRFKIESQAAAMLHHTNIVPVFSVGNERGVHYFAMQFIDGRTLAEVIAELRSLAGGDASGRSSAGSTPAAQTADDRGSGSSGARRLLGHASTAAAAGSLSTDRSNRSPEFFRTVAQLGVQAAEALEHAHQNGIIHRDIKPANLLIDDRRNLWVTDFGLARFGEDTGLTMSGDMLGTLRYMSPEQAMGRRCLVDHRTDIYSLAATLYELLALQPVFDGRDRQELLRQIAFDEPRPITRANASVPAELETIVHKALAKNPAERFDTAHEFADDLRRFLEDRPIRARRPSVLQRLAKFARRHRAVVRALAGAFVVLAVGSAVAAVRLWQANDRLEKAVNEVKAEQVKTQKANDRLAAALDAVKAEQAKTQQALERERGLSYNYTIALADRELGNNYPGRADAYLDASPAELRGWEWRVLRGQSRGELFRIRAFERGVRSVQFSPDGTLLMTAGVDGEIKLWDGATRQSLRTIPRASGTVLMWKAVLSPDGKLVASGGLTRPGGFVNLFDAATGQLRHKFVVADSAVQTVAFSPNGDRVIAAGNDGVIRAWNAATGEPLPDWTELRGKLILSLAVRPDGGEVAACGHSFPVTLLDAATGQARKVISTLASNTQIRYSPDGSRIAVTGSNGAVHIIEPTGKLIIHGGGHVDASLGVAFQPDGTNVVSGGVDRTIRFWRAGQSAAVLAGHDGWVNCLTYSPGGEFLVSGGEDGLVKFWRPTAPVRSWRADEKPSTSDTIQFSQDGRTIVQSYDAEIVVRDWTSGEVLRRYAPPPGRNELVLPAISPDLRRIAFVDTKETVQVFDFESQQLVFSVPGKVAASAAPGQPGAAPVRFSADGRFLASRDSTGTIHVYDASSGTRVRSSEKALSLNSFVPGSERFVGTRDGRLHAWDFMTGRETPLPVETADMRIPRTLVSLDGRRMAIYDASKVTGVQIDVRDTSDWSRVSLLPPQSGSAKLAFTPDGSRLAIATTDNLINIWDVAIGRPVLQLSGPTAQITSLAFSPDGNVLAAASTDRRMYTWLASPLAE